VAVDVNGNVIVLGTFDDQINFGQGPLHTRGGTDVFVAKFGADNAYAWSIAVGDSGEATAAAVVVHSPAPADPDVPPPDGDVYIAGSFSGQVDFFDGPRTSDDRDGFVLKLDADGTPQWATVLGGAGDQSVADIAVDEFGQIVVAGTFSVEIDYANNNIPLSAGAEDAFVAWLDEDGAVVESQEYGNNLSQRASTIATDPNGDAILAINGAGAFSTGGNTTLDNMSTEDSIYLLKLRSDGSTVWSSLFDGNGFQRASDVVVDETGDVWLTGTFNGSIAPLANIQSDDSVDGFFVKLTGTGAEHIVSGGLAGPFDVTPHGVTLDSFNNVVLAGRFELSLQVQRDNEDQDPPIDASGGQDAFVLKLTSSAGTGWGQPFGGPLFDEAVAVAVDPNDNIVIVGHFEHRINFQGALHEAGGASDVFVAKFAQ
jgi:hypothetical protein